MAEFFRISLDVNFEIQSLPKRGQALTPRRRSDPCSYALLDALRASPRSHPWPDTKSPRFGPNADRVRAAEQPAANAASSAEPRLHRYCPAGRGSNSRLRRPDPAFAYPLACPVSPDTSNPTMPAQPSPRACTHVTSARKWTYFHGKARLPHVPADAWGCGSAFAHVPSASKEPPVAARSGCSHCRALPPGAQHSWCARAAERASRAHLASPRGSRSRPWHAPVLGVAWALCAAHTPQTCMTLARDPPTDPRWSIFLACATSAGPGCAAWHRYAAETHGLPWCRHPNPTRTAILTPCGFPGDGIWIPVPRQIGSNVTDGQC